MIELSSVESTISSNGNSKRSTIEGKQGNSDTRTGKNAVDTGRNEIEKDSSSEHNRSTNDVKGTNIFSTNGEKIIDKTSGTRSEDSVDAGYFFTKRDVTENRVDTGSEMMELLLDDDHLSWLTTQERKYDNNRNDSSDENFNEFPMQSDSDIFDDENPGVDDTYILGEQIALALDKAEIDVVGLADGERIAPAIAEALIYSIERDEYDRMNEGWNQFGAESLYSIGGDDGDLELDDDTFSDELVEEIWTHTAAMGELESNYGDEEELILVADSIMNIINGDDDEDEDDDVIEPYSETSSDAIDVDEDDEPPTFHKYVLKVDRTG